MGSKIVDKFFEVNSYIFGVEKPIFWFGITTVAFVFMAMQAALWNGMWDENTFTVFETIILGYISVFIFASVGIGSLFVPKYFKLIFLLLFWSFFDTHMFVTTGLLAATFTILTFVFTPPDPYVDKDVK